MSFLLNLIAIFCENVKYVDCSVWCDWFRITVCVGFILNLTVSYPFNMFWWCPWTPHAKTPESLTHLLMSLWNQSDISQYILPLEFILELLECQTVKASDHSKWLFGFRCIFYGILFVFWTSTIVSIQLYVDVNVHVLHCANRFMFVHVVSSELYIQELSQLRRSTGRIIGFSSYYFSCVKNYGPVLFTLQLTVTRVLCGQDRGFWNSSLLTSYGHARCFNEDLKTDVSFQVDFMLGRFIGLSTIAIGHCSGAFHFCQEFHTGLTRCIRFRLFRS